MSKASLLRALDTSALHPGLACGYVSIFNSLTCMSLFLPPGSQWARAGSGRRLVGTEAATNPY